MIKQFLKDYLLLGWAVYSLKAALLPRNRRIRKQIETLSKIDSLADYHAFTEAVRPLVRRNVISRVDAYRGEGRMYGYYNQMLRYSGTEDWIIPLFTEMEHGVRFGHEDWDYIPFNVSYACQGPERISEIRNIDPNMPVFTLGPYIHYTDRYYSIEKTEELHRKYGRTLVVMPGHTWEEGEFGRDTKNLIRIIYEKYADAFDTIIVNVYWNDIFDDDILEFEKRGAVVLSAGFREDPDFCLRVRTILEMADLVVGDDLGSHIGYCMEMGIPFALENTGIRYPDDEYYKARFAEFEEAFSIPKEKLSGDSFFTEEQIGLQQALFKRFWGGAEASLSPEEMHDTLTALKKLIKAAHYRYSRMSKLCAEIAGGKNPAGFSEGELRLLRQAIARS